MEVELDNYSIHKQMYAKTEQPSQEELMTMYASLGAWASTHYKSHYYMLLCRDINYYTVFNLIDPNYDKFVNEIKECLAFKGRVVDIQYNHAADAYEIWVKEYKTDEMYMYMLFEAEDFVIEVANG